MYSKSILKALELIVDLQAGEQKKANTTDPTGRVDIPKFLAKEDDFWEAQIATQSWENRVVVISDWSFNYGHNYEKYDDLWIYDLMEQDFELYAWAGELVEIHSSYDLDKALKNIQPIHPSHLEKILAERGIEKGRLKIIDYFERRRIEAILEGENAREPALDFHDLGKSFSTNALESIFNSLSPYLFFDVLVSVRSMENTELLVKCATLPQSKGLIAIIESDNPSDWEKLITICNTLPNRIRGIGLFGETNPLLLQDLFQHKALKNLKGIYSSHPLDENNVFDLTAFCNQLQCIEMTKLSYQQFQCSSFDSLQDLKLERYDSCVLEKIAATAPNLKVLHLSRSLGQTENITKIELCKLKQLHLRDLSVESVFNSLKLPSQLEELVLNNVLFDDCGQSLELTGLKKLCIAGTKMPVDLFITLIKNNSHLEEIQLSCDYFYTNDCQSVKLSELVSSCAPLLRHLRAFSVYKNEVMDTPSLLSTLLTQVNSIEEIEVEERKEYYLQKKIQYQKNYQIILAGRQVEPVCLSLFLEHSDSMKCIDIQSELITPDFVCDNLLAHQDKMNQIKVLVLPTSLGERYLALYPTLKRAYFKNISLFHGELVFKEQVDFQLLLNLLQSNNSRVSKLNVPHNGAIFNEALLLEHSGVLLFKSLTINNDDVSLAIISKVLTNSPYLESITLEANLKNQVIECEGLSNSLEKLELKGQSSQTITNFLKQKPSLKTLILDIAEDNDSLFLLLEQVIATSIGLNELVITGEISVKRSQRILDCLLKNNYEMKKLILAEQFVFIKNKELIVEIPTKEEHLFGLLKTSPYLQSLRINQPMPIKKMLNGRLWRHLTQISVVSCLDTPQSDSKSVVETFDFMLSALPEIEVWSGSEITVNFYSQHSFIIVSKIGLYYKLRTTESLSIDQIVNYSNKIRYLSAIDCKAIDGLLLDEHLSRLSHNLSCDLKDTASLLDNFEFFIKHSYSGNRSLLSPHVKLTRDQLELHGDKLSDSQLFKVLELTKGLNLKTVVLYNKLSLPLINALRVSGIKDISLVNVPYDEVLFSQLLKCKIDALTARNSSQQVLYKIARDIKLGVTVCLGVQFPSSLLFSILDNECYNDQLGLVELSFDTPLKLLKRAAYAFHSLYLRNTTIQMEFIEQWLANTPYPTQRLVVSDYRSISQIQLDELAKKHPSLAIEIKKKSNITYHESPQQSFRANNLITQEALLDAVDAKTGEQSQRLHGATSASGYFRQKKNKQPYPNYLRLQVQWDGTNQIKTCQNIPFVAEVVKRYEEHYQRHPEYYLAEVSLSLAKNTWYALLSLTPDDALEAFHASKKVELGYSNKVNLFYIRSTNACDIEIAYMIRAQLAIRYSNENIIDNYEAYFPCIQSIDFETNTIGSLFKEQFLALQKAPVHFKEELLIAFCRFEVGELSKPDLTGKPLLNLLVQERKGVCRHNVAVFVALKTFFNQNVPLKFQIKARAVESDIHSFIEMKHDARWRMICLGGAAMPKAINSEEKDYASDELVHDVSTEPTKPVHYFDSNSLEINPYNLGIEENNTATVKKPRLVHEEKGLVLTESILAEASKLPYETSLPGGVLSLQTQQTLKPTKDFSYVLALNPFKSAKPLKTLPATHFPELAEQVIALAKNLRPGENNLLLNFESLSQIEQFYTALSSRLTANKKRFLLMHQPNQFNPCEFIIDSQTQEAVSQPMTLVKAAAQTAQLGDFLVVNLSNYNEKSVSLLNALTDRNNRLLANLPVQEALTILGVKLNTTEVGKDVYSRFLNQDYVVSSLPKHHLLEPFRKPINAGVSDEAMVTVDFYNGDAWKSQLKGGLTLKDQRLAYQKGALIRMIEAGKSSIRFYNPPMELEEFRVFLITLFNTRQFDANGVTYYLPESFYYESASKTYDLACPDYSYVLEKQGSQKESRLVLNATTYHYFFNNVQCKEGAISQKSGWLQKHAQQELSIWVTGLLHDALWAKLLDTAKTHQCELRLSFESSLVMPASMRNREVLQEEVLAQPLMPKNHIIVSNDAYFSEIQCQLEDETPLVVFEMNENTRFSNLFEFIQFRKDRQEVALDWYSCPVRDHLLAGRRVILKGSINQELADRLNALLSEQGSVFVNGKHETYKGQLILLLNENKYFNSATVIHHNYSYNDFYQHLSTFFPEDCLNSWKLLFQTFLQKAHRAGVSLNFNYLTVKSMLDLYQKVPQSNPFLPFILLHPKYQVLKQCALSIVPDPNLVITTPEAFDEHRRRKVSSLLDFSSSAFMVGASGVGKTTLVKTVFEKSEVHVGLDNLEKWAKEGGLFYLDETNLYPKGSLDFFAGLFHTTPGLLLNNQFYPIHLGKDKGLGSKKHQILFGGNYSDFTNRQDHAFLQQIPVIEFEDFPDWYLKERVLKKAFQILGFVDESPLNDVMAIQLKAYHYINHTNKNAKWTVRNLENMALRFLLFREEIPKLSVETAAWLSVYDELSNHNEASWVTFFQDWIEAQHPLKEVVSGLNSRINHKNEFFMVTDCRKNVFRLMQDQVKIQGIKAKYPQLRDFGAVCGCLLEGESGIGKSKFALELAKSLGYNNGDRVSQENASISKRYYFISQTIEAPISLASKSGEIGQESTLSPIEQRLTTLFHEGALVIIDEFSSFSLEKILNALMSGVDLSMQPAKNPGFFVFATQNPIHYLGRKKLGAPLENRMFKLEFSEYSQNGLYQIANYAGLNPLFAKASAAFFYQSTLKSSQRAAIEAPNFRNYLDRINSIQHENPMSTWYFLETVYRYLEERDRQALYCTSLFCLSAFALLHQPTLYDSLVQEKVSHFTETDNLDEIIPVFDSEEEIDSEIGSESDKDYVKDDDNKFVLDIGLSTSQILMNQNEIEIEQQSCFTGISMQVLGGFLTVLGAAAVAVAFVVLNASSLGLAGVILGLAGGVFALVGVGFFTAGVVRSCSSDVPPIPLTI